MDTTKITLGTPNAVEVLIHYHVSPEKHPRHDAPAVEEARQALLGLGAIYPISKRGGSYHTTELGAAWVKALTRVPIPKQVYFDKDGTAL